MMLQAIKTCPVEVSVLGIGSLLLLLLKILLLNKIPAIFPYASSVGLIFEAILASIISAYLFFLISIQIPKVIDKRHISATIIADLSRAAAANITGFVQFVEYHATPKGKDVKILDKAEITLEKVCDLFSQVKPGSPSSMVKKWDSATPLTMVQAMARHDELCMNYILKIWRFVNYLDPQLIALLYSIENSIHAIRMEDFRANYHDLPMTNEDLGTYADEFFDYYQRGIELTKYFDKLKSLYL